MGKRNFLKEISSILFIFSFTLIASCETPRSNLNQTLDISNSRDNSIQAKIVKTSDDGNDLRIEISGSGVMKNFIAEKAPWYSYSKKIKEVIFTSDVTSIGDNAFINLSLKKYILPSNLNSIGDNAFKDDVTLYSYSTSPFENSDYHIYFYSENPPSDAEHSYWHLVNGQEVIYEQSSILFVGNSFTYYNDMPDMVYNIATDLGYYCSVDAITVGSHNLTQYADSSDEYGKILEEKLSSNQYDYIILQEQSTRSYSHYAQFYKAIGDISKKVKAKQEKAEIRLYATWGYKEGAISNNWTILEMEEKIRENYSLAASAYNLKVHHVGKAFSDVYSKHSEINLYSKDEKHPSVEGSYLAALIHVSNIFNADVRNTTYLGEEGESVTANTAEILKNAAYEVVTL